MELYERLDTFLKAKRIPRMELARALNVPQNTFTRYFCPERQSKLAQHLWRISDLFPELNRDWLFFGEGHMHDPRLPLTPGPTPPSAKEDNASLRAENQTLRDELAALKQTHVELMEEHMDLLRKLVGEKPRLHKLTASASGG